MDTDDKPMAVQLKALAKRVDLLEALAKRVEAELSHLKTKRTTKKNGMIDEHRHRGHAAAVDGRTREGRELLLKRLVDDEDEAQVGRSSKKTCRDGKPDMRTIEGRSLWAAMERNAGRNVGNGER